VVIWLAAPQVIAWIACPEQPVEGASPLQIISCILLLCTQAVFHPAGILGKKGGTPTPLFPVKL
jgi:hypothetical protein